MFQAYLDMGWGCVVGCGVGCGGVVWWEVLLLLNKDQLYPGVGDISFKRF